MSVFHIFAFKQQRADIYIDAATGEEARSIAAGLLTADHWQVTESRVSAYPMHRPPDGPVWHGDVWVHPETPLFEEGATK